MEAKMNVKVAVYVPIVEATPVASKETLEYAIRHFSAAFGGATVAKAEGYWTAPNGALIKDDIAIVYSYTDMYIDAAKAVAVGVAESVKRIMAQDCVTVEVTENSFIEFV